MEFKNFNLELWEETLVSNPELIIRIVELCVTVAAEWPEKGDLRQRYYAVRQMPEMDELVRMAMQLPKEISPVTEVTRFIAWVDQVACLHANGKL